MTTEEATVTSIAFAALPPLGGDLAGGRFVGLTTDQQGQHCAVALLPDDGGDLKWKDALAWADKLGGALPTRPVAALLFAGIRI